MREKKSKKSTVSSPPHSTDELRAIMYGSFIIGGPVGLIVTGVILLVAWVAGMPDETIGFLKKYWWVPPVVGYFIVYLYIWIRDMKERDDTFKEQIEARRNFARREGFIYRPPEYSENQYSTGVITDSFRNHGIVIDSDVEARGDIEKIWFTQIDTEVINMGSKSFSLMADRDGLAKLVSGEKSIQVKYVQPDDNEDGQFWDLVIPDFKARFIDLGLYSLVVEGRNLSLKFAEGKPSDDELFAFLDLAADLTDVFDSKR